LLSFQFRLAADAQLTPGDRLAPPGRDRVVTLNTEFPDWSNKDRKPESKRIFPMHGFKPVRFA